MIGDADRLTHNISRILNLARIESRTWDGEFENVDLVKAVERFRQKNDHLFENCQSELHNPSGRTFTCRLNRDLFEILLINLFTNATKYNRSKQPRLDMVFSPARRGVNVRFEDNGIGIGKAERKKVFRKFYQSGSAEDRSARGTGLGLYLVELIARRHKGKIHAAPRKEGEPAGDGITPRPFAADAKLTFDKLTAVYHADTGHEENQPCHLVVTDPDICQSRCTREFGNPCQHFCPAAVYEWLPGEEPGAQVFQINFSNCVHCKTCDIMDPYQVIDWVTPEGGGGPNFARM